MSSFKVKTMQLRRIAEEESKMLAQLQNIYNGVVSHSRSISFSDGSTVYIRNRLQNVSNSIGSQRETLKRMKNKLSDAADKYEKTEDRICNASKDGVVSLLDKITAPDGFDLIFNPFLPKTGGLFGFDFGVMTKEEASKWLEDFISGNGIGVSASASAAVALAEGSYAKELKYGTVEASGKLYSASGEASAQAFMNKDGMGANAHAEGKFSAAEGEASYNSKYAAASVSGSLYAVEAAAAATAFIGYKDGKFQGELSVGGEAKASVAHGAAEGRLGTENFNAHANAEGSLLGAGAEAKAGVTFDEYGNATAEAKAGAEAYLAKGEVKGGFTFLGIEVNVGAEGMVGVQAEAGGKVTTSGFELDLGLGPIGGNLEVDWSGFKLPELPKIDWTFWD